MAEPTTEELQQLRDELRAEIREAHGTLKDLRTEIKTARELVPLLTDELFTAEVKKQLDQLTEATGEAMEQAVAKVTRSFDDLAATLMGEDRRSRRKGAVPLPMLLKARAVLDAAHDERQRRPR
ncbi:hypothetical protein [Streptomyces sp. NPDC004976]